MEVVMKHYNLLNLFDDLERDFFRSPQKQRWSPASFVNEEDNHYHLALDVPGVDREHLKVDLKENMLEIIGERKDKRALKDQESESYFKFESRYSLPKDINRDEVEVSLNNGVLDIVIPKQVQKQEARSIEIKSGPSQLL